MAVPGKGTFDLKILLKPPWRQNFDFKKKKIMFLVLKALLLRKKKFEVETQI